MPGRANTTATEPAPRRRVLAAMGEPAEQRRVQACLARLGLECELAADGPRAVELALAGNVDLVVMALDLPLMNGLEAASLLRAAGAGMPLVALGADTAPENVARYLDAGFTHWLASPLDEAALAALLAALLADLMPAAPALTLAQLDGFAAVRRGFEAGLAARLARIDALLDGADLPGAAALAHMLKGSAGSFGHPRVSELAGELEQALLDGETGAALQLLAQVRRLDDVRHLLPPGD
ncbi:response regulator [Massilia atriviolacea]|nr:response regulator [Massilia atriviolacea]